MPGSLRIINTTSFNLSAVLLVNYLRKMMCQFLSGCEVLWRLSFKQLWSIWDLKKNSFPFLRENCPLKRYVHPQKCKSLKTVTIQTSCFLREVAENGGRCSLPFSPLGEECKCPWAWISSFKWINKYINKWIGHVFITLTLSQNSYSNFKRCTLYREAASHVGKERGLFNS